MKRILLPIALILSIGISCADNKNKPIFNGVFELKLGMTEAQIRQIIDTTLLGGSSLIFDTEEADVVKSIGAKNFRLEKYEVDTNLTLRKIHFSFFQDTLYSILIEEPNLKFVELLKEKYEVSNYRKDKFEKGQEGEEMITITWNTNHRDIQCITMFTHVFTPYFQFRLINIKTFQKVLEQIEDKKKEIKQKENQSLLDRM